MNLSTNPFFPHGIDKLCTICHMILIDTDSSHSIFSTLEELESPGPLNILQVLQSFSNFNFYNGKQMVCTTCYDKTIDVYKFIQMCNKAHENMQHYLKNVKDVADVEVKIEEINIKPTRIIVDEREFLEEMENEKIWKFDELGMGISGAEIKIEERILKEGREKDETSNHEEITISHTEIVSKEKTDSSDFDNLRAERINAQMYDEPSLSELCKASYGTLYNLGSHDQSHNTQGTCISKELRTDEVCPECQEVFYNDKQLKIHMKRSHTKIFSCNDCEKVFTTKSRLNTHIRVHSGDSHNEVKVKAHECEQCDRRFSRAGHLRRHMVIHTGVKTYKCEQCDQRFTEAWNLRSHMNVHNGIREHKCEQCDRRFTQASHLRSHMDMHNGVKAHKCEQCDRRFTEASNLRRHMHVHNGVKAYKCEQCDRRFTHASSMRRHMLIHNGVKAHKCGQCDRRFTHQCIASAQAHT